MRFKDRRDAGKKLADKLLQYKDQRDILILALPRGGVPVALEVALALNGPLDVFMVRKLGAPEREELALGAVATGGIRVLNKQIIQELNISEEQLDAVTSSELKELERRQKVYRGTRPMPQIRNRTILLIDDGLATGATMSAAVAAIKQQQPTHIIVGVSISSPETCSAFEDQVDEIVCAITPEPFQAVGLWYEDFSQVTDEEVIQLLKEAPQT